MGLIDIQEQVKSRISELTKEIEELENALTALSDDQVDQTEPVVEDSLSESAKLILKNMTKPMSAPQLAKKCKVSKSTVARELLKMHASTPPLVKRAGQAKAKGIGRAATMWQLASA